MATQLGDQMALCSAEQQIASHVTPDLDATLLQLLLFCSSILHFLGDCSGPLRSSEWQLSWVTTAVLQC